MTHTQQFIQDAINGGWFPDNCEDSDPPVITNFGLHLSWSSGDGETMENYLYAIEYVVINPLAWQAVGKTRGWGEWNLTIDEVEHEWELDHYLPDTGKTPVRVCKKCFARKTGDLIEVEYEHEWFELPKEETWVRRKVLGWHGGKIVSDWKKQWHTFIDYLADGLSIEEALSKIA